MGAQPRCHECRHPGGSRRRLHANKKPCTCNCHTPKKETSNVKPIPVVDDPTTQRGVNDAFQVRPESEGSDDE